MKYVLCNEGCLRCLYNNFTMFQCVDPITRDRSMPVGGKTHFTLLPDEKITFILLCTHISVKCNHACLGCMRSIYACFWDLLLIFFVKYFASYFTSLIDTGTPFKEQSFVGTLTYFLFCGTSRHFIFVFFFKFLSFLFVLVFASLIQFIRFAVQIIM